MTASGDKCRIGAPSPGRFSRLNIASSDSAKIVISSGVKPSALVEPRRAELWPQSSIIRLPSSRATNCRPLPLHDRENARGSEPLGVFAAHTGAEKERMEEDERVGVSGGRSR